MKYEDTDMALYPDTESKRLQIGSEDAAEKADATKFVSELEHFSNTL